MLKYNMLPAVRVAKTSRYLGNVGSVDVPLRFDFDRRLKLEFHGSGITTDAGWPACRELDDALGLTDMADHELVDPRTGKNGRHAMTGLFRQSVFGRIWWASGSALSTMQASSSLGPMSGSAAPCHRPTSTTILKNSKNRRPDASMGFDHLHCGAGQQVYQSV